MRIAVCFSGQPRTWRRCYKSWKILIDQVKCNPKYENENFEIDCFIHMWNFNTTPLSLVSDINNPHHLISDKEIETIKRFLKPKKMMVENSEKSKSRHDFVNQRARILTPSNAEGCVLWWAASPLYSIMRSAQLKCDYEMENNFKYDMCVKMRFDGSFDQNGIDIFIKDFNPPLDKKTIYSMHSRNLAYYPFELVGDIFFYSDSETYNVLSSLFNWIPILESRFFSKGTKVEEIMGFFIRMFDLKNKRSWLHVEIVREIPRLI